MFSFCGPAGLGGLEISLNTRESHGLSRDTACKEGRHRTSSLRFQLYACELLPQLGKMTRVFIGRLSMSARESDVERFLRGYGKVRDISLKRGYGFVVRRIWIVPCRFAMKSFFCDAVLSEWILSVGVWWLQRCWRRYCRFEWQGTDGRKVSETS